MGQQSCGPGGLETSINAGVGFPPHGFQQGPHGFQPGSHRPGEVIAHNTGTISQRNHDADAPPPRCSPTQQPCFNDRIASFATDLDGGYDEHHNARNSDGVLTMPNGLPPGPAGRDPPTMPNGLPPMSGGRDGKLSFDYGELEQTNPSGFTGEATSGSAPYEQDLPQTMQGLHEPPTTPCLHEFQPPKMSSFETYREQAWEASPASGHADPGHVHRSPSPREYSPAAASPARAPHGAAPASPRNSVSVCSEVQADTPPMQTAAAAQSHCDVRLREAWEIGTIVEVYSASANCWYVARIMQMNGEVITAQFMGDEGPKQKSIYRNDLQVAPLGAHTAGELPPGFQVKPSQSRPGQVVYLDATTGVKYSTPELAWKVHLERLMQQPISNETQCNVNPAGFSWPSTHHSTGQSNGTVMPSQNGAPHYPEPPAMPHYKEQPSMSLAELNAMGTGGEAQRPAAAAFKKSGPPGKSAPWLAAAAGPKVALPSFGDQQPDSNQAAYLRSLAHPSLGGAEAASPTPFSHVRPMQQYPDGMAAGPGLAGLADVDSSGFPAENYGHAMLPPRPVRYGGNPAFQQWQEDPFSQWRRS